MAPPRRAITHLGERLRAAREAVRLDQAGLAKRIFVSVRQISRWENGGSRPNAEQAQDIVNLLSPTLPPAILEALAHSLGVELPADEEPAPPPPPPPPPVPVVAAPPPPPPAPPPPPPPPRPTAAELRASFDAIIYAAAEDRDVLPRHLRAFAVELFRGADRLGVNAKDAAELIAIPERAEGKTT